jgi:hypothetical protein
VTHSVASNRVGVEPTSIRKERIGKSPDQPAQSNRDGEAIALMDIPYRKFGLIVREASNHRKSRSSVKAGRWRTANREAYCCARFELAVAAAILSGRTRVRTG